MCIRDSITRAGASDRHRVLGPELQLGHSRFSIPANVGLIRCIAAHHARCRPRCSAARQKRVLSVRHAKEEEGNTEIGTFWHVPRM
eukprot:1901838-Prymnesium_polylepis.1